MRRAHHMHQKHLLSLRPLLLHSLAARHTTQLLLNRAQSLILANLSSALLVTNFLCGPHLFHSRLLIICARALHVGRGVGADGFL